MDYSTLLMGIIPLLVFVIVDSFAGLKSALFFTVLMAIAELSFSLIYFHDVDFVTIISFVLVFVMAILSYKFNSPIFVKFQPVILGAVLGLIFLISYMMGKPLFYILSMKYKEQLPQSIQYALSNPQMTQLLVISSHLIAYAFFAHALLTAYAALKWSKWWWIAIRGIGLYFFIFIAAIISAMMIR